MTIRKMVEIQGDDHPAALLIGIDVLRSIYQGEPCTEDGCFASSLEWTKYYGKPTKETIDKWLYDLGEAADKEIDPKFLDMILEAD